MSKISDTSHEQDDQESVIAHRKLTGITGKFFMIFALFLSLLHLYILNFHPIDPWIFRSMHVLLFAILGFALVPGWNQKNPSKIHWSDWIAIVSSVAIFIYIYVNFDQLIYRSGVAPTQWDFYISFIGVILVLELTRRTTGWTLPILSLIFIAYAFLGPYLPGIFQHNGYRVERFFSYIYSLDGIFGVTTDVSSKFLVLFIIFGTFLQVSKVGDYFVDFSFSVAGGLRGGPAKVSILASGLMGMINGSAAGNAVATGTLTIPLMKKVGYRPRFAAAIEATSSTGGQIMPPIMGAGAFLMAEIMGVPYTEIMLAALIPALLYFASVYFMVDLEAIKLNLKGLKRSELPNLKTLLKKSYLFIPIVILIASILMGYSIIRAGTLGIISCFLMSWLSKQTRMGLKEVIHALTEGARSVIQIVSICATAGIIVGVIALTGIGGKFSTLLFSIGSSSQLLALVFAMLLAVVLGMGMPTTAAYAVAASVVAPGLIHIGIDPILAHMFIFYYAVLSSITPPVAMAAFAAAGVAGTNPMKTGFEAFHLGLAAFIIPFMFVYSPTLLMIGSGTSIALAVVTSLVGIYLIAGAIQGYFFGKANWFQRILLLIASLALINDAVLWDVIGISLAIIAFLITLITKRSKPVELSL